MSDTMSLSRRADALEAKMAQELDYVPLPDSLVTQIRKTWKASITSGGQPVWSAK